MTPIRSFEITDPNAIVLGMLPNCSLKERSKLLQWLSFGVSELRPFHSAGCKNDRRKSGYVAGNLSAIELILKVMYRVTHLVDENLLLS